MPHFRTMETFSTSLRFHELHGRDINDSIDIDHVSQQGYELTPEELDTVVSRWVARDVQVGSHGPRWFAFWDWITPADTAPREAARRLNGRFVADTAAQLPDWHPVALDLRDRDDVDALLAVAEDRPALRVTLVSVNDHRFIVVDSPDDAAIVNVRLVVGTTIML